MKPVRALLTLAAIGVAGFVMLGWAWHGTKHARYVPLQAPWVISGGLGGLALIGLAAASWYIYLNREDSESHRQQWAAITRDLVGAVSLGEAGRPSGSVSDVKSDPNGVATVAKRSARSAGREPTTPRATGGAASRRRGASR